MNAIDFFDRGFDLNPDAPCLIHGETGEVHRYRDVRDITLRVARRLQNAGFKPGQKAAVLSYNDPLGYSVVLSLLRAGLTWIPINPRNALADNAQVMGLFDCEVLFLQSDFASALPQIRAAAPGIREFVCIDAECPGAIDLKSWLGDTPAEAFDVPHDAERLFAIQPTGGTTGFPKGVMMSNRALEAIVSGFLAVAPCKDRPVFLAAAPLTHAAGMVMQHLLAQGGAAVVMPHVDRSALLDAFPKHGVTHTFLPPTVIYELLAHPGVKERDYRSLRYFFYGASPMAPDKLRQAVEVFGPVMAQIYGQTESGVPLTFLSPADHFMDGQVASLERLGSCGRPSPFARVAIMDDEGRLLGNGEIGEIVTRGQGVMSGYYKDEAATAEVSSHGWHHTSDVGYRDDAGYYYIVDRKKDMIISGGFNIYSAEVERALMSHPAVRECAVIGVPDPKWGESVKAVVVRADSATASGEELIAHCKSLVGSMKSPKTVDFVDNLPRSPVGKVLKREIRQAYWVSGKRQVS